MKTARTIAVLILCAGSIIQLHAQENKYKAKYLLNLTNYISWNDEEVTIGVVGNSPVLAELEALIPDNSKIKLIRISDNEKIRDCNLIFLPNLQSKKFEKVQEMIGESPIILVAENESLMDKGAEMTFIKEDQKLKFAVNKSAMDETGIKVSNKLIAQVRMIND